MKSELAKRTPTILVICCGLVVACHAPLHGGQPIDIGAELNSALAALTKGHYLQAHQALQKIGQERLSVKQQIRYWELQSDLAYRAGDYQRAGQLSQQCWSQLAPPYTETEDAQSAQAAAVCLARIAALQGTAGRERALQWYAKALRIEQGYQRRFPLWEPRIRLEVARLYHPGDEQRQLLQGAEQLIAHYIASPRGQQSDQHIEGGELLAECQALAGHFAAAAESVKSIRIALPQLTAVELLPLLVLELRYQRLGQVAAQAMRETLGKAESLAPAVPSASLVAALYEEAALFAATQDERTAAESYWRREIKCLQRALVELPTDSGLSAAPRIELLQRLLRARRHLEEWGLAVDEARELATLREQLLIKGDVNIERAQASLAGVQAMAACDWRTRTEHREQRLADACRQLRDLERAWGQNPSGKVVHLELFRARSNLVELLRFAGDLFTAEQFAAAATLQLLTDAAGERRSFPGEQPTHLEVASFQLNYGCVLTALGKYRAAHEHFEQSKRELKKAKDAGLIPWRGSEVHCLVLLNEALCRYSQGQTLQAADLIASAVQLREQLNANLPEEEHALHLGPYQLAAAAIELRRGEQVRVVDEEEGLKAFAAAQRQAGYAAHSLQASASTSLSQLRLQAQQLQARALFLHAEQSEALRQIRAGNARFEIARLQKPRELWEAVLSTLHRQDAATQRRSHALKVRCLTGLLMIMAIELENTPAAEPVRRKQLWQSAEALAGEAALLVNNLQAYPNLVCQVKLQRAEILLGRPVEDKSLSESQVQQRRAEAIQLLLQAIDVAELPRASTFGGAQHRAEYFATFSRVFDLLVDAYVDERRYRDAMSVSEWRRGRTLRDQLQAAQPAVPEHQEPCNSEQQPIQVRLQQLEMEYDLVCAQFRAAQEANELLPAGNLAPLNSPATEALQPERIQILQEQIQALRQELRGSDPFRRHLSSSDLQGDSSPLGSLDALVTGDETQRQFSPGVLLYHIGSQRSHVFWHTKAGAVPQHFELKTPGKSARPADLPWIENETTKLINWLREISAADPAPKIAAARRLTETLLPAGLRSELASQRYSHCLILADGPLHRIPFAALPLPAEDTTSAAPNLKFVADWEITLHYAPSALVQQQLNDPHRGAGQPLAGALFVSLAPNYRLLNQSLQQARDPADSRPLALFDELQNLAESAAITAEFRAHTGRFGAGEVHLLGEEAKEIDLSAAYRLLPEARFIHFAAHGLLASARSAELSGGLPLAAPGQTADADGLLDLKQIEQLQLRRCDLVILSACDTYQGQDRPLEIGVSIGRAFLAAGAKRVLCSQWKVSDDSTHALMLEWTRQITAQSRTGSQLDYARALKQASQAVRSHPDWNHPRFWAPFVLVGPATGPARP